MHHLFNPSFSEPIVLTVSRIRRFKLPDTLDEVMILTTGRPRWCEWSELQQRGGTYRIVSHVEMHVAVGPLNRHRLVAIQ